MRCLTLTELIGILALCVAIAGVVSTHLNEPAYRKKLGLDSGTIRAGLLGGLLGLLLYVAVVMSVAALLWFFLCGLPSGSQQVGGGSGSPAGPQVTPTPRATPTPHGPIIEQPPVEISGAEFTLYVFLQEYHWKKGKVVVEFNEQTKTEEQMKDYLMQLVETLKSADAIICVGTSSQAIEEGKDEPFEEDRAFVRAEQLILWMRPVISKLGKPLDIYNLNLGHYRELPDKDEQRLVLLIKIEKVDPRISIADLLSPANSSILKQELKKKNFPFSFDSYSLFNLRKKT